MSDNGERMLARHCRHVLEAHLIILIVVAADNLVAEIHQFATCMEVDILYINLAHILVELNAGLDNWFLGGATILHLRTVSLEQMDGRHLEFVIGTGHEGERVALTGRTDAVGEMEQVLVDDRIVGTHGTVGLPEVGGSHRRTVTVSRHLSEHHHTVGRVMHLTIYPSGSLGHHLKGVGAGRTRECGVAADHLERLRVVHVIGDDIVGLSVLIFNHIDEIGIALGQRLHLIVDVGRTVCLILGRFGCSGMRGANRAYQFVGTAHRHLIVSAGSRRVNPGTLGHLGQVVHMGQFRGGIHPPVDLAGAGRDAVGGHVSEVIIALLTVYRGVETAVVDGCESVVGEHRGMAVADGHSSQFGGTRIAYHHHEFSRTGLLLAFGGHIVGHIVALHEIGNLGLAHRTDGDDNIGHGGCRVDAGIGIGQLTAEQNLSRTVGSDGLRGLELQGQFTLLATIQHQGSSSCRDEARCLGGIGRTLYLLTQPFVGLVVVSIMQESDLGHVDVRTAVLHLQRGFDGLSSLGLGDVLEGKRSPSSYRVECSADAGCFGFHEIFRLILTFAVTAVCAISIILRHGRVYNGSRFGLLYVGWGNAPHELLVDVTL